MFREMFRKLTFVIIYLVFLQFPKCFWACIVAVFLRCYYRPRQYAIFLLTWPVLLRILSITVHGLPKYISFFHSSNCFFYPRVTVTRSPRYCFLNTTCCLSYSLTSSISMFTYHLISSPKWHIAWNFSLRRPDGYYLPKWLTTRP